ncbi:hypothetical protein LF845_05195 [Deferribacterales bacterium Es71-Z0220]|uniref:hypothetical protein n=1 Tax=Deferrivibrio essentukiensis TaxID=2880922 RepID=UPI001F62505B|nr:hypothetical protein [Deferrivibrio essentukiensis]MCB4204355.1 hypothetical protein [Deferrivibrio essentukiensis]
MEKDKNFEWIKEKLNKGKEELVKFTKISKVKIEIASTKKKMDEKFKNLGLKVYQMSKEGEILPETLELDFEKIKELENSIAELEEFINELREKGFKEDDDLDADDKSEDIVEPDEVILEQTEEIVEVNVNEEATIDAEEAKEDGEKNK